MQVYSQPALRLSAIIFSKTENNQISPRMSQVMFMIHRIKHQEGEAVSWAHGWWCHVMFPSSTPGRDNLIGDKQSQMTTAVKEIHEIFPITRVSEHRFSRIIFARLRALSHNKAESMISCSGFEEWNPH